LKQEKFSDLLDTLKSTRQRYANTVLKECKKVGLSARNPIHRAAILNIGSVDYELIMGMIPTLNPKTKRMKYPF
jgi:hypothetical protein